MKKYRSTELLDQLQSDVRGLLVTTSYLQSEDPGNLLQQPAPGKWSVMQVLEHLNSYGYYYLPAIKRSLQKNKPAVEFFKPGWAGDYFTRMMQPTEDGKVKMKMKAPKDHRPLPSLDPKAVTDEFIKQQHVLLDLLEFARKKISAVSARLYLLCLIKLKVGIPSGSSIAHEQRHFLTDQTILEAVKALAVQEARDLIKRQLEPAVNDDLGQACQVGRRVHPITRGGTPTRGQQPDVVIVVKRPDRDAKSLRDFADGELVHLHLLRHVDQAGASRRVRVKSTCSNSFGTLRISRQLPRATHSS